MTSWVPMWIFIPQLDPPHCEVVVSGTGNTHQKTVTFTRTNTVNANTPLFFCFLFFFSIFSFVQVPCKDEETKSQSLSVASQVRWRQRFFNKSTQSVTLGIVPVYIVVTIPTLRVGQMCSMTISRKLRVLFTVKGKGKRKHRKMFKVYLFVLCIYSAVH